MCGGHGGERMAGNDRDGGDFAVVGGGCFWCIEAVYRKVEGVTSVRAGYAGGRAADPSYERVCSGGTGHAEVVRIDFDPAVITYADILATFFRAHDPTTVNRQGADVGSQYRSIVLYAGERQREIAERARGEAEASGRFGRKIVTEVAPLAQFYPAEEYHQRYFEKNPHAAYCRLVIAPKLNHLVSEPIPFLKA